MIQKSKVASNVKPNKGENAKEMITPLLRKSLTKQGYKLIGSHSGVKICRWTKSMLRGRGGCYKHTFYGIDSHRCMEATPSLACANKCVFCWRHHSNPVGTEWRWKMESAEFIFQGAVDNHRKMINEFKGVPGVLPDKLAEGMVVKHCALSLVGEPIMYPEINKFVKLLHQEKVSSFLVTNAQFPEAIRDMEPVTQLYVSVDASTKESLKKIDRPLFKDFWERFIESLKELKSKGQRTVYRLTLVKGWKPRRWTTTRGWWSSGSRTSSRSRASHSAGAARPAPSPWTTCPGTARWSGSCRSWSADSAATPSPASTSTARWSGSCRSWSADSA